MIFLSHESWEEFSVPSWDIVLFSFDSLSVVGSMTVAKTTFFFSTWKQRKVIVIFIILNRSLPLNAQAPFRMWQVKLYEEVFEKERENCIFLKVMRRDCKRKSVTEVSEGRKWQTGTDLEAGEIVCNSTCQECFKVSNWPCVLYCNQIWNESMFYLCHVEKWSISGESEVCIFIFLHHTWFCWVRILSQMF